MKQIITLMKKGIDEWRSIAKLSMQLDKLSNKLFWKAMATMVSIMEIHRAYENGKYIVVKDLQDSWKIMMKYCFEELDFKRLYLDHYTGNPASKLYLSLGFKYEGVLRKNCRKNGILYDVHLMSMLREEYDELK